MLSVIIPSHNRKMILQLVLDALAKQTFPADQFEVIIVLDGCTDGSNDMLREYSAPFVLRMIEQEAQGASAARNQGASQATGELLLFLDDDIEPVAGFIEAHVEAQQGFDNLVVIGYCPALLTQNTYFSLELRGWWEAMYRTMGQPGHRFLFSDMLSGNFSISRDIFLSTGGFDLKFLVHEDYEFGVRLIQTGVAFAFEPKAIGIHHEKTDIKRPLYRKYQEGIADIQLGRMYPELIPNLLITRLLKYSLLPSQLLRFLRFRSPKLGDWLTAMALMALPIFEKARMLKMWRRILDGLLGYWYWKGVSQELTTLKEVNDFVVGNSQGVLKPKYTEIDLDLSQELEQAEQILDRTRPDGAKIYYEQMLIGHLPPELGAEKLRAAHLRPFLVHPLVGLVYDGVTSRKVSHPPTSLQEIVYSNNKISSSAPLE